MPDILYTDTASTKDETAIRRHGYAEVLMLSEDGVDYHFGPGQWQAQLELYDAPVKPGSVARRIITHLPQADDDKVAIMALAPAVLSQLTRSEYYRQVWVSSPEGETFLIVDAKLLLQ